MEALKHLVLHITQGYNHRDIPVTLQVSPWTHMDLNINQKRVSHTYEWVHLQFLQQQFSEIVGKDQWLMLTYKVANTITAYVASPCDSKRI